MKPVRAAFLVVVVVVSACVSGDPRSPTRNVPPLGTPLTLESMAADAARGSQPRAEHRALDVLAGSWTTRNVAVGPTGTESDERSGEARIAWILGGRFLEWRGTLALGGDVHSTTGYLGFDLNHAEYQLVTISDLATGMGVARGTGAVAGAGIHFNLEIVDRRDGSIRRAQSTLRVIDRDHFVLEQIGLAPEGVERVVRRTHHARVTK